MTKTLLSAILKEGRLPFEVRVNTSETKGKAHDMPDFVLGDDKMFVGVYGEVKRANVLLEDLALSTEQNDQIGRYLARRTCGVLVYWRARRAILGLWFRAAGQASASESPSLPSRGTKFKNFATRKKCAMGTSSAASPW